MQPVDMIVVSASEEPDGLDRLREAHTRDVGGGSLMVLPTIFDTHEHRLEASRNLGLVRADEARSLHLVAYPADSRSCELDELAEVEPLLTVVGGRASWDPDGRMG